MMRFEEQNAIAVLPSIRIVGDSSTTEQFQLGEILKGATK
jgi:hypothetical protein